MGVFDKIADEAAKQPPAVNPRAAMPTPGSRNQAYQMAADMAKAAPVPTVSPASAAPVAAPVVDNAGTRAKALRDAGSTAAVAQAVGDQLRAGDPAVTFEKPTAANTAPPLAPPVANIAERAQAAGDQLRRGDKAVTFEEPGGPKPQEPEVPPSTPLEAKATPTEAIDLVGKGDPDLTSATDAELAGVPPELAQQPGVRDKLKKLGEIAKAIGVPLLHLIQAGAYGYGGIEKPTVLQTLKAQQADRSKTQEGQAFALKAAELDRDFASKMAEIDKQYQATRDTRGYQEAKAAAEQEHANRIEQIRETGRQAKGAGANPELTAKFASQFIPKG